MKLLEAAIHKLDNSEARELVFDILRGQLDAILSRYVGNHRKEVVAAFEDWWEKYRTTLVGIDRDREATASKLSGLLRGLGYA